MKFHGVFNPPADQILYENYLKGITKGIFVECGAGGGIYSNNSLVFEQELGWNCVNIEANPCTFETLKNRRANSFLNINVALSNKCGTAVFNKLGDNGTLKQKEHQKILQKKHKIKDNYQEVKTITFKALVEKYNIKKVDAMVLDVEGHELEVLEGFRESPVVPDVLCLEYPHVSVSFVGGLREMSSFIEKNHGYYYNFFAHNNAYFSRKYKADSKKWFGASDPRTEWVWKKSLSNWGHRG